MDYRDSEFYQHKASDLCKRISTGATSLIKTAFEGIDSSIFIDYHVHVVGSEAGNNGNFVNQKMLSPEHPEKYLKFKIYLNAADISNVKDADVQYMKRLKDLALNTPHHGRYALLAFDKNYNQDGSENSNKTEFFVSNDYVFSIAEKDPDMFIPVMSVHPYRKDAIEVLARYAKCGGKLVKWLPNAMGIDLSDIKCESFYQKMKELHLILITHGGEE